MGDTATNGNGPVIHVPIQINGGGEQALNNLQLLERELFVLDNGILYVGGKGEDEKVTPVTVVGRVIEEATIEKPTLVSPTVQTSLILDDSIVKSSIGDFDYEEGGFVHGQVVFTTG